MLTHSPLSVASGVKADDADDVGEADESGRESGAESGVERAGVLGSAVPVLPGAIPARWRRSGGSGRFRRATSTATAITMAAAR